LVAVAVAEKVLLVKQPKVRHRLVLVALAQHLQFQVEQQLAQVNYQVEIITLLAVAVAQSL
jgi:hypothetical protein